MGCAPSFVPNRSHPASSPDALIWTDASDLRATLVNTGVAAW
ncbi:hypothetical protein ACS15_1315 [Ralstonia insidiosa]|uniref:Uncharacterized protein n=1 Tax=Ralstonia insidiosa TaxID=190721 RepID=A0AAC9BE53_9RALS|nr:hypothetical protein ACS15_1315 [Ralstonia insidiosa]